MALAGLLNIQVAAPPAFGANPRVCRSPEAAILLDCAQHRHRRFLRRGRYAGVGHEPNDKRLPNGR